MREPAALTPDHPFLGDLMDVLRAVYADRLVAVALYGSVAR